MPSGTYWCATAASRMNELPLFLLGTVLFPGGRLPLRIFENRYMEMAKACLRASTPFGVCLIREGKEVGDPAVPWDVGTLARIASWDMPQLGLLQIVAQGERRFRIRDRRVQPDGLARASVELLPEDEDGEVPAACGRCRRLVERLAADSPGLIEPPLRLESASWLSQRLAELLPLSPQTKQQLLEMTDARARLERLNSLLTSAQAAL
jgi:uncharacterized protein